ncbi:hypothetical protein [Paenibacillus sp. Marseille-Q4541]|uniref:DUF7667 family protein n=1 Tax=Paenibacillus sp. Marseille-Q4541 TaxID=2831522 RepID=UPI001BAAE3A0
MSVAIHDIHRMLAAIYFRSLTPEGKLKVHWLDQISIVAILQKNAELVHQLDSLKSLAFHAHEIGDMDWQQEICKQIEELEAQCI